jgi:propanol-preferring alcohol dehydrogenase
MSVSTRRRASTTIVPATQAGWRITDWDGEPAWQEFPVLQPTEDEVLIRVEACGVGLTVVNALRGELGMPDEALPLTPGHEIVGRVVALGQGVQPSGQVVVPGQRVVAYFYLSCGACRACVDGDENLCVRFGGFIGVHRDGGYAPYVVLPAFNVIPLEHEIDPVAATVIPDAVATPLHVCGKILSLTPSGRVAVIGAGGGVGAHMVQVAALFGAEVVGLDVEDDKLALVEELGARPVDSTRFEDLEAGSLWHRGGPTAVVDLVGSQDSLRWAVESVASGGTVVVLTPFRGRSMTVDPREAVLREIAIRGSRYATRAELRLAADLVAAGHIRSIVSAEREPKRVLELHGLLERGSLVGRGAVRWPI